MTKAKINNSKSAQTFKKIYKGPRIRTTWILVRRQSTTFKIWGTDFFFHLRILYPAKLARTVQWTFSYMPGFRKLPSPLPSSWSYLRMCGNTTRGCAERGVVGSTAADEPEAVKGSSMLPPGRQSCGDTVWLERGEMENVYLEISEKKSSTECLNNGESRCGRTNSMRWHQSKQFKGKRTEFRNIQKTNMNNILTALALLNTLFGTATLELT